MRKKRIKWIDCLRGFGMILIIIGHTYATGFWQYLIFAVNVPIFFVLSGYLTHLKTIKRTLISGIYTLLIPYFLTVIVMFLTSLITIFINVPLMFSINHWYHFLAAGIYGIGTQTKMSIVPGQTIPAIGAIWFLLAMYIGNIIYQVLLRITIVFPKKTQSLLLICAGIALALLGFWISKYIQLPWSINAAFISTIFYVAGHLIKDYSLLEKGYLSLGIAIFSMMLWIISAIKGPFWFNTGYAAYPLLDTLGAIGGTYFLMYSFKKINEFIQLDSLAFLGRMALIALSFHIICVNLFTDVTFLTTKFLNYGVSTVVTGWIMDLYRIIICYMAVWILAKSKIVKRLFAIR